MNFRTSYQDAGKDRGCWQVPLLQIGQGSQRTHRLHGCEGVHFTQRHLCHMCLRIFAFIGATQTKITLNHETKTNTKTQAKQIKKWPKWPSNLFGPQFKPLFQQSFTKPFQGFLQFFTGHSSLKATKRRENVLNGDGMQFAGAIRAAAEEFDIEVVGSGSEVRERCDQIASRTMLR